MKKLAGAVLGIQIAVSAVLIWEAGRRDGKNMVLLFCLCLLCSHASLFGMWGAASAWKASRRFAALAIGTLVLAAEFHWARKTSPLISVFLMALPTVCLFAIVSTHLTRTDFAVLGARPRRQSPRLQFTIMQILALTAFLAVAVSAARFVSFSRGPLLRIPFVDADMLEMETFSLCAIPLAAACWWSLFAISWSWRHWLAILFAPVIVGLVPVIYWDGPEPWIFMLVSFVEMAVVGGSLLPLRLHGYRCVERGLSRATKAIEVAPESGGQPAHEIGVRPLS